MCHWSSRDDERRLRADPGRSFFQVLRDLFRRNRPPHAGAPEGGAEVIPLHARGGRKPEARGRERADAA